jgi:hypothetical protein
MIDNNLKIQIKEAIEYEQPISLLLKTSVATNKRMEVIKLIMQSKLPTKVSNFKIAKKIDADFLADMQELNRQFNERITNQWIIVFKDRETMNDAFAQLDMEDIPEECAILAIE